MNKIELISGVFVKQAGSSSMGFEAAKDIVLPLAGSAALAAALGTGLGYGTGKLTAPGITTISNLRKEEEYNAQKRAIDELKTRIATKRARLQSI